MAKLRILPLLIFFMMCGFVGSTYAVINEKPIFVDVPQNHWAYKEIIYTAENKIIYGYGNGYFGTNDNVTREHAAAFMYRHLKPQDSNENPFIDIEGSSFKKEILALTKAGIFSVNSERKFNPKGTLSRAELATILVKSFKLKPLYDYDFEFEDMKGHWANEHVKILHNNRITNGTGVGTFSPGLTVTRAQLAVLMYNSIHLNRGKTLLLHTDSQYYRNASFIHPIEGQIVTQGNSVTILTDNQDGWFYVKNNEGISGWIAPYGIRDQLTKKTDLYDEPMITRPSNVAISPQKVTILDEQNDFKEIKTYKGRRWIPNDEYAMKDEELGARFDDPALDDPIKKEQAEKEAAEKDKELEMYTAVQRGNNVFAVPKKEFIEGNTKELRVPSGEYYTINLLHNEQLKNNWCGPASTLQALTFHKFKSGSSYSLPKQEDIAKQYGIFNNSRGSSSSQIKEALNGYKTVYNFKNTPYVMGNISGRNSTELLLSRVRNSLKKQTNAPILLVDTYFLPRYGHKSFRHYVTVSGYDSRGLGIKIRIADPLHYGNSSPTKGGVYWESFMINNNWMGLHRAVESADYYGANPVMIY